MIPVKPALRGLSTFLPNTASMEKKATGGTISARYCYSVWLRHLVVAADHGVNTNPKAVAELGPGDSLGMGLAALLTGAEHYVGLDVVGYSQNQRNAEILEELIHMFEDRSPIPGEGEFPKVKPYLADYSFPSNILSGQRLDKALSPERLDALREAVWNVNASSGVPRISYQAPWQDNAQVQPGSVDWIFSQATLEHIDDLPGAYRAMRQWLRPGGIMSHQIDFSNHGMTPTWNDHWTHSTTLWRIIRGRRLYLLNRQPGQTHLDYLSSQGFEVTHVRRVKDNAGARRDALGRSFRFITDEDLDTRAAFVLARMPESPAV